MNEEMGIFTANGIAPLCGVSELVRSDLLLNASLLYTILLMTTGQRSTRSLLLTLLQLLLLFAGAATDSCGQSAFFEELYGRALRLDETLPLARSERTTLLWMSYLADPGEPSVLYDLAGLHMGAGEGEEARELLSRSFAASGHDYHTGLLLLSLAGYNAEWDIVEAVRDTLLAHRPGDTSVLYTLMQVYQMGGKDSLAIEAMRKIAEEDENDPRYTFRLSEMLTESGRTGEAEELLRNYLDRHPGDLVATQMLITHLLIQKRTGEAEERLKGLLRGGVPEDPTTLQILTELQTMKGDYPAVVKVIRDYALSTDAEPEVTLKLIRSARDSAPRDDLSGLDAALLPLRGELVERFPDTESYQLLVMQHFIAQGDTAGVLRSARELTDRYRKARPAYDVLLEEYIRRGDNGAVRDLVRKGLEVYPLDPAFLFYDIIGDLIRDPEGSDVLREKIDHALSVIPEEDPRHLEITVAKADLLEAAGRWEEARPLYEKAAARGHIAASNNLAYFLTIYGTEEDLPYAEKLAGAVVEKEPDNATYLDTYAWILYKREAYTLAKLYMEKAIAKAPEPDKTYWEHYARILSKTGDYIEAIDAWKKAADLGLDPDTAAGAISELQSLLSPQ